MSDIGESIIRGAREALAFANGEAKFPDAQIHIPKEIDVKRIRTKLGLSQKQFAESYGFSLRTVQEWEQGRMVPSGPARAFLVVLDREPEAVNRALSNAASEYKQKPDNDQQIAQQARLAKECAKLDPNEEKAMAEEGLADVFID